jgi:hypothetical protein
MTRTLAETDVVIRIRIYFGAQSESGVQPVQVNSNTERSDSRPTIASMEYGAQAPGPVHRLASPDDGTHSGRLAIWQCSATDRQGGPWNR